MSARPSQLAAVARYYRTHQDKVKARHKAYRDANKARLNAYQKEYRSRLSEEKKAAVKVYQKEYQKAYYRGYQQRKPRVRRIYIPKPKAISVPRDPVFILKPITQIISMHVTCSYCEAKFRRGTSEYYEGTFDKGEFCCGDCQENLELEA